MSASAPLAMLLSDALAAAGISNAELARRLAAINGSKASSKRRLVQKYLSGATTTLTRESARDLASALGTEADYFDRVTPRPTQQDLVEQMKTLTALVEELRQLVVVRLGEGPPGSPGATG